jgi:hypothetical protein
LIDSSDDSSDDDSVRAENSDLLWVEGPATGAGSILRGSGANNASGNASSGFPGIYHGPQKCSSGTF